jgi:NTP pyrophosphatase (non-canonical NTP hydrolase)
MSIEEPYEAAVRELAPLVGYEVDLETHQMPFIVKRGPDGGSVGYADPSWIKVFDWAVRLAQGKEVPLPASAEALLVRCSGCRGEATVNGLGCLVCYGFGQIPRDLPHQTPVQSKDLTIRELQKMAFETSAANGWHKEPYETVVPEAPKTQLAALSPLILAVGELVEAIRTPDREARSRRIAAAFATIETFVRAVDRMGLERYAEWQSTEDAATPMDGSVTQTIAHLILIVSEVGEAIQALENNDAANLREELADIPLRLGDTVERLRIDLTPEILAKNERNRQRAYRHGGKLA